MNPEEFEPKDDMEFDWTDGIPDNWKPKNQMSEEEFNENLEYLQNHPLFMKKIPDEKDLENNEQLQAIQNIMYDDTPENVAKHCNERGNKLVKRIGEADYFLKEAIKAYTDGINQKCKDNSLIARLYSNRAFLYLKQKKYGYAIEDCKEAVVYDPAFIKPYYRMGFAYFNLQKYVDCIKITEQGLKIEANNQEITKLKTDAEKRQGEIERREKEQMELKEILEKTLYKACYERNIILGKKVIDIPEAYNQQLFVDKENVLHTPILVIYPEFNQSDFIQDSRETDCIEDHLIALLEEGLPWDSAKNYELNSLEVYIELNSTVPYYKKKASKEIKVKEKGLKLVDKSSKIINLLSEDGYIVPAILDIYIVSKKSKFYKQFLSTNVFIK